MNRIVNLLIIFMLLTPAGVALSKQLAQPAPQPENDGGIWYEIDLGTTPLANGINEAFESMDEDKRPIKVHQPKVPKELKIKGPGGQDKKVGWMSQNTVILDFEDATKKGNGKPEWDPISLEVKPDKGKPGWEEAAMLPAAVNTNRDQNGPVVLSNGFLSGVNNDKDCVDQISGERFTGADCFKNAETLPMVNTLVIIEGGNDENYCHHRSVESVIFSKEECQDREWTTLEEMIDEDGPENPDVDGDGQLLDIQNGENDDGDCVDNKGNHYPASDCSGGNRYELIDEDLVDKDGNIFTLDNDGDGVFDEDPVEDKEEWQLCQDFYIMLGLENLFDKEQDFQDGECNMDKAVTAGINEESKRKFGKVVFDDGSDDGDAMKKKDWKQPIVIEGQEIEFTYPKEKNYKISLTVNDGSNQYTCYENLHPKADNQVSVECFDQDNLLAEFQVTCDSLDCTFMAQSTDTSFLYKWELGAMEPGNHQYSQGNGNAYGKNQGPRRVTVTETMLVQCKPGWDFEEASGGEDVKKVRCKKTNNVPMATLTRTSFIRNTSMLNSISISNQAMMGFTFAPPVIEWGWKIEEEACIFGFCFEIFFARVGYEFDLGVGLRLPVEMNAVPQVNWPDDVWAQDDFSFETSIKPLDFSTADYLAFCNQHNLDDEWYIDSCERFSFPNFLNPEDGDEFVAYYSIFAGIIVRVLGIPLITWGIDSSLDLGQVCTMYNALNSDPSTLLNLAKFMGDYQGDAESAFYDFLKDEGILCGSFTTPYGYEDDELRTFPLPGDLTSYSIPADCINAMTEGQVVTIKGKPRPICTNLILGTKGANLGIGLELELLAGSENIGANWTTAKDAAPGATAETSLMWEWKDTDPSGDYSPPQTLGPVVYDNYDLAYGLDHDDGLVLVDDFTYYLDLWLAVYANLEFGGILSPLPDLAKFKLFDISFGEVFGIPGIPIPQHPGTEPIVLSAPVKNYGVEVVGNGVDQDKVSIAQTLDQDYLASFDVSVTNIGSLPDSFDNFDAALTNIPQALGSEYIFTFNHDNDHDGLVNEDDFDDINNDRDCINLAGEHFTEETCFNGGVLVDGYYELIDEDPADDQWWAEFSAQSPFDAQAPYDFTEFPEMLVVHPFKHSMTKPDLYPVRIFVDSVGAKEKFSNQLFPSYVPTPDHQVARWGAYDVVFVEIVQFFDPQPIVKPEAISVLPGESAAFNGQFKNGGNVSDTLLVSTERLNFNQGECDLVTMGTLPECPYRSEFTQIQESWVEDDFTGKYVTPAGSAAPSGAPTHFIVSAPSEWAGMEDASYIFEVTAISKGDLNIRNTVPVTFEVRATKESQIRYIWLELDAFLAELEQADSAGVKTCGVNPITLHPIQDKINNAFELITQENQDIGKAVKNLEAAVKIIEGGLLHTLEKCNSIPNNLFEDWNARANALLNDLILASQ